MLLVIMMMILVVVVVVLVREVSRVGETGVLGTSAITSLLSHLVLNNMFKILNIFIVMQ